MKREDRKALTPLYKEFVNNRGKGNQALRHNGVVGVISKKKMVVFGGACYGNLKYYASTKFNPNEITSIILQINEGNISLDNEVIHNYYEWLLNYSPWRKAFVSKSVSKVLKDKCAILDASKPANLMISGAIAFRQPFEKYSDNSNKFPLNIHLWNKFVNKGITPNNAFILSQLFSFSELNINSAIFYKKSDSGHKPINLVYLGDVPIYNFIKGIYNYTEPFNKIVTYHDVDNLFSKRNSKWINKVGLNGITNDIKSKVIGIKKNTMNNCIFAQITTDYYSQDEVVEISPDLSSIIDSKVYG